MRSGEADIYQVPDDDEEMKRSIKIAEKTLRRFDSALMGGNPYYQNFALKNRFGTQDGAEHIWVTHISLRNKRYYGVIDNVPNSIQNLKIGDTVEVENITDWMYIDNGVLRGGYTIRLIRDRISTDERKAFDAIFSFRIEPE